MRSSRALELIAAVNERETAHLAALGTVAGYELDGTGRPVLQSTHGATKLEYVRAAASTTAAAGCASAAGSKQRA